MIELYTTGMAHGGEAVARRDGKAHFVPGALPNEHVIGEIVRDKGSWARVDLVDVVTPSPARVDPPCPHFSRCGGCQWQHADYAAQLEWKRSIVEGQLAHLGGLHDVLVEPTTAAGPEYGYRNRIDFSVASGRPALHRYRSKALEPLDVCLVLRPELASVFDRLGSLDGSRHVTMRCSVASGEVLVIVEGTVPPQASDWGVSVAQRSSRGLKQVSGSPHITERIDGSSLRVTGGSFFQNNSAGAAVLVGHVRDAIEPRRTEVLLDGYAGGGLFAATVGRDSGSVIAIEVSPTAVADLRHNLEEADIEGIVYRGEFEEQVIDELFDVVVVDPPRAGLGTAGVTTITSARPRAVAYVSCDPAALARDARDMTAAGYHLDWVRPVDMFPQTFHIEAVARFIAR